MFSFDKRPSPLDLVDQRNLSKLISNGVSKAKINDGSLTLKKIPYKLSVLAQNKHKLRGQPNDSIYGYNDYGTQRRIESPKKLAFSRVPNG